MGTGAEVTLGIMFGQPCQVVYANGEKCGKPTTALCQDYRGFEWFTCDSHADDRRYELAVKAILITPQSYLAEHLREVEADPLAPQHIGMLPDYWDERREREGKPDKSHCAADLRQALASRMPLPFSVRDRARSAAIDAVERYPRESALANGAVQEFWDFVISAALEAVDDRPKWKEFAETVRERALVQEQDKLARDIMRSIGPEAPDKDQEP